MKHPKIPSPMVELENSIYKVAKNMAMANQPFTVGELMRFANYSLEGIELKEKYIQFTEKRIKSA